MHYFAPLGIRRSRQGICLSPSDLCPTLLPKCNRKLQLPKDHLVFALGLLEQNLRLRIDDIELNNATLKTHIIQGCNPRKNNQYLSCHRSRYPIELTLTGLLLITAQPRQGISQ